MKRRFISETSTSSAMKPKVGYNTTNNHSSSRVVNHKTVGLVLLSLLLSLYLTDFYHIASAHSGDIAPIILTEIKNPSPSPTPFLLQYTISEKSINLPGAISSTKREFDDGENDNIYERNTNLLPGAIGVKGHFDEHDKIGIEEGESERGNVNNDKENMENKKYLTSQSETMKSDEDAENKISTSVRSDSESNSSEDSELSNEKKKRKLKSRKRRKKRYRKNDGTDSHIMSDSKLDEPHSLIATRGPHPMNREMTYLQVDSTEQKLNRANVRSHYRRLVQKYLTPFSRGIERKSFFDILKRRTYSMSPPGSNKGTQTVLFQLMNKRVLLLDPYEMATNAKPFYQTRMKELTWLLSEVLREEDIPNVEFILAIHDCVQTVNQNHTYRGATFIESSPTFTIVACNFSDNIPFPMWEGDAVRGGLQSWDEKMEAYQQSDNTLWSEKIGKAVFRGGNRASMYFKNKKDANQHCDDVGRTRLAHLGEEHSELFDVGVTGMCGERRRVMKHLSEEGHHSYKYILYAEGNCFWADRLNKQIFGPSVIIKQETPCGQFWEPLMKPMTHYIPTDFFFRDVVDKLKWTQEHDVEVQQIVRNANNFAASFLTEDGIKTYVKVLLTEYAKLLKEKNFPKERGSVDVTVANS